MKRLLIHLVFALALLSFSSGASLAVHRALVHNHHHDHHAHHENTGPSISEDCQLCQITALRVLDTVVAPLAPAFSFQLTCVLPPAVDGRPHDDCVSIEQPRAPPAC